MQKKYFYLTLTLIFNSTILFCQNTEWIKLSIPTTDIQSVGAFNESLVLVGTMTGIYRSTDMGNSWSFMTLTFGPITAMTMNNGIIYLGAVMGIYSSSNLGISWDWTIDNDMYLRHTNCFAVNKLGYVYSGSSAHGVFRSTNNGSSWTGISVGLPLYASANSICITSSNIMYVGSFDGVYSSSDFGNNWTNTGMGDQVIAMASDDNDNIYIAANGGRYYILKDKAISWESLNPSPWSTGISMIKKDNAIYVATMSDGMYKIANGVCNPVTNSSVLSNANTIAVNSTGYMLVGILGNGIYRSPSNIISGVEDKRTAIPTTFKLEQNYPNPFNPTTIIQFSIPIPQFITLKVFNTIGEEIATLVNEEKSPGNYEVKFDASLLSSGVYFYRLTTPTFISSKKLLLIK